MVQNGNVIVTSAPDAAFLTLVNSWSRDQADLMLGFVWQAYDALASNTAAIDGRDLERSITQLLEPRIRDVMSGDEPFYVQHSPFERETMALPPAQPPAYDLAFVLRSNERIMWPMEAKVLETAEGVSDYVGDIRTQFLTCRYAPFSSSGAMIGYLLGGTTQKAFDAISAKLQCTLASVAVFVARAHRMSRHSRTIPAGKSYPESFTCHHLLFELFGVKRATSRRPRGQKSRRG